MATTTKKKAARPKRRRAKKKTTTASKKKPAAKTAKAKSNGNGLIEEAKRVLPLLRAGKTTMGEERDRLGFSSNTPMRLALIEFLPGGRKEYNRILKASQKAYFARKAKKGA